MFAELAEALMHARVLFRGVLAEPGDLWMQRSRHPCWGSFECKQKVFLTGAEV